MGIILFTRSARSLRGPPSGPDAAGNANKATRGERKCIIVVLNLHRFRTELNQNLAIKCRYCHLNAPIPALCRVLGPGSHRKLVNFPRKLLPLLMEMLVVIECEHRGSVCKIQLICAVCQK